jgi:Ca-activated chloride channel homolog
MSTRWRTRGAWWVGALAGACLASAAIDGQELAGPPKPPAYRSGVELVSLHVTVTDPAQRYVTGLVRDDFSVFEDGARQELTLFGVSEAPLALAMLLDSSASIIDSLPTVQEAAAGFVRELRPRDVATIIEFDTQAQISTPFTSDRTALEGAIRQTWPDGATALYDAIYIGLKEFEKLRPEGPEGETKRRAMVVLSDGDDTSSVVDLEDTLELARRASVVIYAIGIGVQPPPPSRAASRGAAFALRHIAQETGGRVFFAKEARKLSGVYQEIARELSSQYVLGYASTNIRRDGRWRRIAVKVRRENLVVRTKPGYYSQK